MNWNFSAWSIRHPVPPILLFVVLTIIGVMSFRHLAIEQFPNIDVPVIAVSVSQAGATPGELETQVSKIVEDAVAGVTGVKHITSTLSDGSSVTAIEFRLEIPTQKALQDTKDAIARVRSNLPAGVDEPIVQSIDVEGQAIQTYAVKAPGMTLEQLSWYVDDKVKRDLQALGGVGRVERYGGVDREIRINLDPTKLQALGVTAGQVNAQLASTNVDSGAGRGNVGGMEQAIRTLGGAKTLGELRETKINLSNGRSLRLGDLGEVIDSNSEQRTFARYNGESVVTFSVFRAKGASSTEVAKRVADKIAKLTADSKGAVSFSLVDDTVYFIYGNYKAAMEGLIEGAILAVVVVLLFLRNWRATLISAVALPLSAFPAFWAMSLLGFSLNLVSFLAITLATGILVDDAIVEIENIARHMRMGKSPYRASLEAADEIGLAVVAISLSIVSVFAPVSFMGGIAGQYFKQFGLTVAVAVVCSLMVARLITPMMTAYLLKEIPHEEAKPGLLMRSYIRLLRVLNWGPRIGRFHPNLMSYGTVVLSFLVLMGAMSLFPLLPSGFIPKGDDSRFVLSVELPPGSRLEDTRSTTDRMASILRQNTEVQQVFVLGGSSPTGTVEPRRAAIFVNLKHRDVELWSNLWNKLAAPIGLPMMAWHGRTMPQWEIENDVLPKLSGVPDVQWAKINPRGAREVEFNMLSNDPVALNTAAKQLEAALRSDSRLRAPMSQGALSRPEIQITPKTEEAARLGITTQQISQAVRVATIGDFGPLLAKFSIGDRQVPIRVQVPEKARGSLTEILNLRLPSASGGSVPLSSVAEVTMGDGPSTVKRYDRQRQATIGADLPPGIELGDATKIIEETATKLNFPPSVVVQKGADAEVQGEIQQGFAQAAGIGVLLMLVVLVLLLGNVFQPFAILLSLPLSLGGVVLALLLTRQAFSMPVIIGMLMLIGIVAKNAIMLVDFAVERQKNGMERVEAVIDAGLKRARPIVMTTIAMGAGMFPTALGIGEGSSFRSPMATAVIGGLIVSTFLSLIFVPSYFVIMDDLARLTSWIFGRFLGKKDEPEDVDPAVVDLRDKVAVVSGQVAQVDGEVSEQAGRLRELASQVNEVDSKIEALRRASGGKGNLKLAAE